ncbi:histidine phosphatase family protein [Bacillus sp. BP-3]|uniref:histidine phosphatase family protein n=1 Tax=Bacillus sp. BP-3 TaxID=3022773 RepID=UPI00232B2682|nr:histidine phosphatase family protein [Bacillus sp. BP-3]MDC2866092.1 histidine phosphatase family protein [Bacillus sp. BP-3]
MQISFIRHGSSSVQKKAITVRGFQEWQQRYEHEDIMREMEIPIETMEVVESSKFIVSSDQKIAVQSAAMLTSNVMFIQNSLFREAAVPSILPVPNWIKCKPDVWMFLGRAFWMIGYSRDVESYLEVQRRAKQAADVLVGYANVYQRVTLVGHSYFNKMIGKELCARGWRGPLLLRNNPWGCTIYTFHEVLEGNVFITYT